MIAFYVWFLMGAACAHDKCDDPKFMPPMGVYETEAACQLMAEADRQGPGLIAFCTRVPVYK